MVVNEVLKSYYNAIEIYYFVKGAVSNEKNRNNYLVLHHGSLHFSSCGGNGKQNESTANYDTIENIYKNTQRHQEVKLGNLTFSGSVRVPEVSEVYTLKLARKDYVPDMEAMVKMYSDTYDLL